MRQIVAILTIMLMTMMAAMVVIIIGSVQQSEQLVDYANELQETKTILKKQTLEAVAWQEQAQEYETLLIQSQMDCDHLSIQLEDALLVVEEMTAPEPTQDVASVMSFPKEGETNVLQTSLATLEAENVTLLQEYETLQETHASLQAECERLKNAPKNEMIVSLQMDKLSETVQKALVFVWEQWPKETLHETSVTQKNSSTPLLEEKKNFVPSPVG